MKEVLTVCLVVFKEWENAHVHDYIASNGTLKNRRWSEGSTTIKQYDSDGNAVYFLTYSANKSVTLPFLPSYTSMIGLIN